MQGIKTVLILLGRVIEMCVLIFSQIKLLLIKILLVTQFKMMVYNKKATPFVGHVPVAG